MTKKLSEADIAEKVLNLMFENEEVEDFITALNQSAPEVKAWLQKVLPNEEKRETLLTNLKEKQNGL